MLLRPLDTNAPIPSRSPRRKSGEITRLQAPPSYRRGVADEVRDFTCGPDRIPRRARSKPRLRSCCCRASRSRALRKIGVFPVRATRRLSFREEGVQEMCGWCLVLHIPLRSRCHARDLGRVELNSRTRLKTVPGTRSGKSETSRYQTSQGCVGNHVCANHKARKRTTCRCQIAMPCRCQ